MIYSAITDMVKNIEINKKCSDCSPCEHELSIVLHDGREKKAYLFEYDIYDLINAVAKKNIRIINPLGIKHFSGTIDPYNKKYTRQGNKRHFPNEILSLIFEK